MTSAIEPNPLSSDLVNKLVMRSIKLQKDDFILTYWYISATVSLKKQLSIKEIVVGKANSDVSCKLGYAYSINKIQHRIRSRKFTI